MGRISAVLVVVGIALGGTGCAFITRSAVSSTGAPPASGGSGGSSLSADGRYAVIGSDAPNLVPGDTNTAADVFVRDHFAGTTERVSVATAGTEANDASFGGVVSPDGRFVAFMSYASNLVANDNNAIPDVFVRDRLTSATTRVSIPNGGGWGDGDSTTPSISADGRYVAFESYATNLVPNDTNDVSDIFVRDRTTNTTKRVSVASDGTESDDESFNASLSADGRYVAFDSLASTLVLDDTNWVSDIFVRDRTLNTTTRASLATDGTEADLDSFSPIISRSGRYVAFYSDATNLIADDTNSLGDAYLRDLQSGATERVSLASDGAEADAGIDTVAGLSDDARYVLFNSSSANLIAGVPGIAMNVYLRDRTAGTTTRVGVDTLGRQSANGSIGGALSGDARYVLFTSYDPIIEPDANGAIGDVFLRSTSAPLILGVAPPSAAAGSSLTVTLSGSGFRTGAVVMFGPGIAVNGSTVVNEHQVDVSITIAPSAVLGLRTPTIINPGTGPGPLTGGLAYLPDAFTVT